MIYLYTRAGSKHAIDSRSMTLCKSLVELGKVIFNDLEKNPPNKKFSLTAEDMIGRLWFFRVYEADIDSGSGKLKKVPGKKLLKLLKEQDELKPKFIKHRLRD